MKNSTLEVLGSRTAYGLRQLASEANVEAQATLDFDWKLKPDSDHWPFYERRIPYLMFHTGLHEDYHRPSDDAHRINHSGLATSTRLILFLLAALDNADELPTFRDAVRREPRSASSLEQPVAAFPSRYGIPFRVEPGDPAKIILTGVASGSAAERGGLKAGDHILEFQGRRIAGDKQFRQALLAASGETTFLVQRPGSSLPQLLKVRPTGEPIRVGVSWRTDEAEPGTVILTHVTFGSAAHQAGLQVRDRVHAVGGQRFKNQDEFSNLLTTVKSPLELRVERSGKVQTFVLNVLDDPSPATE
jgi:S1-C subfamily serine protease